jgi:hypothetical protein
MRSVLFAFALAVPVVLTACGGGAPPAEIGAPAPVAAKPTADAGATGASTGGGVDTAALEKLTSSEAKSGTCDVEHKAALEKALDDIEKTVRAKTEDDGKPMKIESFTKRVLALSEAAKGVQLTLSGKGTQVHVIAIAPKEVSLDVLAGNQPATTTRSPYRGEVVPAKIKLPNVGEAPLEGDSRQIEMKPGMPLDVRMRGQGCAGVVVFSKS